MEDATEEDWVEIQKLQDQFQEGRAAQYDRLVENEPPEQTGKPAPKK